MKKILIAAAIAVAFPLAATAAPVDLSGWTSEEGNGSGGANWQVQGVGNDSVFQSNNSRPSVFFDGGANAQGTSLAGSIKVETSGDDDFIGFVLGYNTGEFGSSNADFWLIDWKQANQGGSSGVGLSLGHVTGNVGAAGENDFWSHTGVVSEVQRATNLGLTGWGDNVANDFELVFTSTLIEVKVNNVVELSYTSAQHGSLFTDGSFGFYNYSQGGVRYAGITEDVVPGAVPLPAGAWLMLTAMGGIAAMRRRRKS